MAELEKATAWVEEWAGANKLGSSVLYAMRLCLEEALANVVMHGKGASEMAVDAAITADMVVLTISDDGPEFDPLTCALPKMAGSLDDIDIGGQGLNLVQSFSSGQSYHRDQGRNRLELLFIRADDS